MSHYAIGIDLGTTNCALAFVDLQSEPLTVRDFAIPQVVAPGEIELRDTLPSSCYVPAAGEFATGALLAPGVRDDAYVVGHFACQHGAEAPVRLIASAKSWLCHEAVDRTAPLLPWHGAPDVPRVSPAEASSRYLVHLRAAWDAAFPDAPLAEQEVTITVPASFDEVARELTIDAATRAGLGSLSLIEEPQAAFYAWMSRTGADAAAVLQAGQRILVCDVGGGTSDFSLIEARIDPEGGVRFHRVAVGDHLILGGDNMDLALAHFLEPRFSATRLDPRRWGLLVQACRRAKETLFGPQPPESLRVSIAGGSRLIGGAMQTELTRAEAKAVLLDGFFPQVGPDARPEVNPAGFREFGLPYADDPAITRHLAAFLARQTESASSDMAARSSRKSAAPEAVLFNGGVFASELMRLRMLDVLQNWRYQEDRHAPRLRELPNDRLDLAVARGAAHAAALRHTGSRRLAAGLARAYFIQVGSAGADGAQSVVCLAPSGLEEGHEVTLPQTFDLRIRQPVAFTLFTSATRIQDPVGAVLPFDAAEMKPLPPVHTVLRSGESLRANAIPVQLHVALTEIGTLDVRCVAVRGQRSWKLAFDVRGRTQAFPAETMSGAPAENAEPVVAPPSDAVIQACRERVAKSFEPPHAYLPSPGPTTLMNGLEALLAMPRDHWPLPLLRALWEAVLAAGDGRTLGPEYEVRWLNLLGFALRPGFGYPVDDWRVRQTWHAASGGTVCCAAESCRAEWWILWRRIAGALDAGQQVQLAAAAAAILRCPGMGKSSPGLLESAEAWRLIGALELLAPDCKTDWGEALIERLERGRPNPAVAGAMIWAWGRLGARIPASGLLNTLVPLETADAWVTRLIGRPPLHRAAFFAVVQLARETGDRYRDISEDTRTAAVRWLHRQGAPARHQELMRADVVMNASEKAQAFGESLPPGLHLR
ncbi:MAG: Hsp70 family protein [Kiritimatiellia bacterium]